ncbi:MAG: AMP-binding protein [Nocardioides sp.]|nr:AMP-binding protein [Nocardioides sp.]
MVANLTELLDRAATTGPDRPALVDTGSGRTTTWSELATEVALVAQGLVEAGLVAGHRVGLVLGNRSELVTAYLAVLRAGMVAVPMNPKATTGELVRMLADSGCRLVLAESGTLTGVRAAVAGLADVVGEPSGPTEQPTEQPAGRRGVVPEIVVLDEPAGSGERAWASLRAGSAVAVPPPRDPESLAVLLYTSGTSSRPRAAMLPHRALAANVEQAAAVEPAMIRPDDVVLGVLPLFHVYGLNAVLGTVLHQAATLVLVPSFDPEGCLDVVAEHGVTVLPVAPPVFGHWRKRDRVAERLRGVRQVLSGSAPLGPELVVEFQERTGVVVHQGYGLTEAAPVVTSTLVGGGAPPPGSVGAALPGIELRLVDETGAAPEGHDPGEIVVRGANLFTGYWPDGEDGPDADGWWATGDVGFLDEQGRLFLVDRLKELVIVSGFNVYPSEVEDVVAEVDGVLEVAVIGVADEETGEAVVAYLRLASGRVPEEVVDDVRRHTATRLARFKQPREVHVVDQLPHTATGKVAKGRLRATERRRALGLLE